MTQRKTEVELGCLSEQLSHLGQADDSRKKAWRVWSRVSMFVLILYLSVGIGLLAIEACWHISGVPPL